MHYRIYPVDEDGSPDSREDWQDYHVILDSVQHIHKGDEIIYKSRSNNHVVAKVTRRTVEVEGFSPIELGVVIKGIQKPKNIWGEK